MMYGPIQELSLTALIALTLTSAAAFKLHDFAGFREDLTGLLPRSMARVLAAAVPLVEIAIAAAILVWWGQDWPLRAAGGFVLGATLTFPWRALRQGQIDCACWGRAMSRERDIVPQSATAKFSSVTRDVTQSLWYAARNSTIVWIAFFLANGVAAATWFALVTALLVTGAVTLGILRTHYDLHRSVHPWVKHLRPRARHLFAMDWYAQRPSGWLLCVRPPGPADEPPA